MKKLHILVSRHYDFNSSHFTTMWLDQVLPKLSQDFLVKITWFCYFPKKILDLPKKYNENILQIQDFSNAVDVIKKTNPDIIIDSEFPSLIDLSFLAASKKHSFFVRKYSKHTMFKVPINILSTLSLLNQDIPISNKNDKQFTKRRTFYFYKYLFFIKSIIASKLTLYEKLNFFIISVKWNFITEIPLINSKIQTDLELLNSNVLKEKLLKKGYSKFKLSVVGSPIFDNVFKNRTLKKPVNKKLTILFAPFQRYGNATQDELQKKIILEIIGKIVQNKENFSVFVKLHPSYHNLEYFKDLIHSIDDSIEIFQKGNIEKYIEKADLIITNGIVSNSTVTALIMKKPIIFCDFYNLYSYDEYKNLILECRDSTKLIDIISNSFDIVEHNSEHVETFLEQHYFKTDGLASDRIADAIKKLVKTKN